MEEIGVFEGGREVEGEWCQRRQKEALGVREWGPKSYLYMMGHGSISVNAPQNEEDAKRRGNEELGDASHDHTDCARFEGTRLRGMRPLTATTARRGSVRIQFLGPTKRSTPGPFLKVHLAKRLRNTELTHSTHTPAERPTCMDNMDEPIVGGTLGSSLRQAEGHPGPPTERNLFDPLRRIRPDVPSMKGI
ncbi:hypothetical protein PIB30_068702 [Stylosanthes scabra]|uniref:Uncharacterized protein n=1 Tax=Stylosanthes scabra TaxID=79078 RepID=A0ABU6SN15_9FABA|nr:hypothetical protein [Stylosanthes scabra]